MKTLLVFMLAIAVLLFVDALPYVPSKPSKITIPLKKKPITSRRSRKLDRRLSESLRIYQQESDLAYYGELTFGHANGGGEGQSFNIQFDTGSADLWVMSVACNSPACQEKDSLYDRGADTDFQDLNTNFGIKYQDGGEATGISASTIVQIGDYSSRQDIGYVETVTDIFEDSPFNGVMGMALNVLSANNQVTLMSNLFDDDDNGFDAKQFSFLLGRDADDAVSELTIGGTSQARYDGAIYWSDLSDDNQGYWAIPVDDIVVNGQPLNFVGRNGAFDTGASRIVVSFADAELIYANFEYEMVGGVYQIDCNIDITVGLRINGAIWNMDRRDFVIEEGGECYGAIVGANIGSPNTWFLGTPFMKNVYSVFDLGNLQVGLAQLR